MKKENLNPHSRNLFAITSQREKQMWERRAEQLHLQGADHRAGLYLVVQAGYLLLAGGGEQKGVHLGLQSVVHLHVDVVAGRLLLVVGVHAAREGGGGGGWDRGVRRRRWCIGKREPAGKQRRSTGQCFGFGQCATTMRSHLITWLMMIGSGGISSACSRCGISENFIRCVSKICRMDEERKKKKSAGWRQHR